MFDQYDIAWAQYQKKLKLLPLPILSWDVFSNPNVEVLRFNSIQKNWINKVDYHHKVANKSVIITDNNLNILFVTRQISELTGYTSTEIIGQSPKMFQGALTNQKSRTKIREAIKNQHPFKEIVINYKKDGTYYKCEIEAYPKFDANNNLINYIAYERLAS